MAPYRQIAAESMRALMVLTLVLFGFSQGTAAGEFPVGASPAVAAAFAQSAASDLCGGGWGDHQALHAPCHACRTDLTLLPPPPKACETVAFTTDQVEYRSPEPKSVFPSPRGRALSRAPPLGLIHF